MTALTDNASFWNEKYLNSESSWDLNSPNPVFIQLLNENKFISRGKILIAGCGKGYDAIAAAQMGYDVTAIDFSSYAINFTNELAAKNSVSIKTIEEDIFVLNAGYENQFDIVYDYVMYCAINPDRRREYAEKISSLLKPDGKYVALFFPVEKREGGPPFGISLTDTYSVFSHYLKLELSNRQVDSIKPRKGREVLQIYRKINK